MSAQYSPFLDPKVSDYIWQYGTREPAVLVELREETANSHPQPQMQLGRAQGQLLQLLVLMLDARRSLDVGTFTGYSSLAVALALPDDGHVVTCDLNETDTAVAQRYWKKAGVDHKVDLRLQPAADTLQQLLDAGQAATFDLSVIDADKARYQTYFDLSIELIRPGGVITIDNTLWSGRVTEPEPELASTQAIHSFNTYVHSHPAVDLVLLPLGDGITVARKRHV